MVTTAREGRLKLSEQVRKRNSYRKNNNNKKIFVLRYGSCSRRKYVEYMATTPSTYKASYTQDNEQPGLEIVSETTS